MRKIVAVAGTNAMKINGTREGLQALVWKGWTRASAAVRGVAVPDNPSVRAQPFGMMETRAGARFRALAALDADAEADYGVGIENGVTWLGGADEGGIDFPVIAVASRQDPGHVTYATGMGIQVERRFLEASVATDCKKTCGQFIAEETGFEHADWHRGYTGQATCRQEIIAAAVFLAFATLLNGH